MSCVGEIDNIHAYDFNSKLFIVTVEKHTNTQVAYFCSFFLLSAI